MHFFTKKLIHICPVYHNDKIRSMIRNRIAEFAYKYDNMVLNRDYVENTYCNRLKTQARLICDKSFFVHNNLKSDVILSIC